MPCRFLRGASKPRPASCQHSGLPMMYLYLVFGYTHLNIVDFIVILHFSTGPISESDIRRSASSITVHINFSEGS